MIKHTDLRKKEMLILTDDNLVGEGEIGVNWFHTRRGAKYSGTLQVSRRKGAEASHVKSFLVAIKYLLDGFLEKAFSQNMLDSFVVSAGTKSKDVCNSCGYSYKTRLGETLHKCDLEKNGSKCTICGDYFTSEDNLKIHLDKVHAKDAVEPMEVSNAKISADQFLSALLDHVVESRVFVKTSDPGNDTLPAPKKIETTISQYLAKWRPGSIIKPVAADGSCALRALSQILFGTQNHFKIIGSAVSKYIVENIEKLEASNEVFYPLERKVSGQVEVFQDREQFISFLKSERSLYSYREGTDLQIIADLFKIQIHVLISRNNKMENGVPMKIGEKFGDNKIAVMVLNMEDEHYNAVLAPDNTSKNFTLMNKMKRYVEGKDAKKDNVDSDKQRERFELLERNLGILQSRLNFFEKEKQRTDAQVKALEEKVKVLDCTKCNHLDERKLDTPPPARKTDSVIKQPVSFPQHGQVNPVKDMDVDVDQSSEKELDELNRLKAMKDQGFVRVSPQAKAHEKPQPPMFCLICNIRFENKDALREHKGVCPKNPANLPGPKTDSIVGERIQTLNSQQKVPILNRQARSYNCEECAFQATGGGSSKALLKHFRESGHKANSLEEKCYSCGEIFSTFADLMIHRREKHIDKINKCRYYAEGSCKFGQRCWYSHEMTENRDNVASDFQKEKRSIPPDVRQSLAVLLEDLLEIHKKRKENMKKPPGA